MNNSYFYLYSHLLSAEHVAALGKDSALWLYLWLLNQAQYQERALPDAQRSFTVEWSQSQAAVDLGVARRTITEWHKRLCAARYVTSCRSRYGLRTNIRGWTTIRQWLEGGRPAVPALRPDVSERSHLDGPDVSERSHLDNPDVTLHVSYAAHATLYSKSILKQEEPVPDVSEWSHLAPVRWRQVCEELRLRLPRPTFDLWLRSTEVERYDGSVLVIRVCNQHARDWLDRRLRPLVEEVVWVQFDRGVNVEFVAA